ncbi:OsmC family protein [Methanomassiliicoccus luminyensis]|jgi:uncharacterized OsmC-like protein|uniref:OsmC family protein n=1 Tax=Methanomassiliicoccus luminyensis TaxID=1080712 RepID=UPI00037495FD|nr:OsmC family protein [Methanomassiliicoccus luminyensis]
MDTIQEEKAKLVNGVDVQKLEATVEAINKNPDLAEFTFHAVNEWVGGARNRTVIERTVGGSEVMVRDEPFVVPSDQPSVLMGSDEAPNAVTMLMHALASSLSVSIVYHAATRGINIEKLSISMEGDVDLHGFLGLSQEVRPGFQDVRVEVDLKSDASRAQAEELLRYAQKVSPVVDTLRNRIPLEINLK